MASTWIGLDESTTIDVRVDAESVVMGTTTVYRERMQVAGVSSGAIAPVSSVTGLTVNFSTASTAAVVVSAAIPQSSVTVAGGQSSAIVSSASVIRVKSTVGYDSTVTLAAGSTMTVSFTAASSVAATISGQSTAIQGAGLTTALSSQAWLMRLVDIDSTVGGQINSSGALQVAIADNVNVSGSTVVLTTASAIRIESTVGYDSTVTLVAGSSIAAEQGTPTAVSSAWPVTLAANSTGITQLYDVDSSVTTIENVQGISIRLATTGGSVEGGSTANPFAVLLQDSTATVTIQGNTTVALAAGSTLTASLTAGSTIGVDLTTASKIRIESTVGYDSTVTLAAGSTLTASLTAGSTIGANITGGQSTVIQGAGLSSALSSQAWYMRLVDYGTTVGAVVNSSGELLIAGTLSATDSTASTGVQKLSGAGSTVQAIIDSSGALSVDITESTGLNVSGSTIVLAAGSTLTASLTAGTTLTASLTAASTLSVGTVDSITTGAVRVTQNSSQVIAGTTAITVQYASIPPFATSGAVDIISSVANTFIRVLAWNLIAPTTAVLTWFSDSTANSTLAGPYHLAANGGISVPYSPVGWFQTTAAGLALALKSETASSVGGNIVYIQSSAIA
jgi:hypothetical protein